MEGMKEMSDTLSLILMLIPIAAILAALLIWKKPADITGIIGFVFIAVIAFFFYKTSVEVILRAAVGGAIKSFTVSLIVATSLLQMALMQRSGALARIIVFIKTISSENRAVQIMIINIGFGTLMVSVGATPVSILPPILLAMGYTTYTAIALPAIGYDALCTYALLGAPVVVFVDIANSVLGKGSVTLSSAGSIFWLFIPIVSTLIGFCMLWIVDKWNGVKKGFLPCITTGIVISVVSYFTNKIDNLVPLTGVICGVAVILAMAIYLKVLGKKIFDRSRLTKEDLKVEKSMPLWKAFMPWILLIVIILALNLPKESFDFLYRTHIFPINGLSPDGSPIATRVLWNAYTWIFVSTLLSIPFLKPSKGMLTDTVKIWAKRAPRPVFAAAIFFSIGEIMSFTGYNMVTKTKDPYNMVTVLVKFSASVFDKAYGLISPFIGLLGGFITGSEASTLAMFGKISLSTAQELHFKTNGIILIGAALAFGAGLASVISPAKLQNAAASIDKLGEENKVIRIAFVFSIFLTAVTAIFAGLYIILGVVK
jgi:lactate permease